MTSYASSVTMTQRQGKVMTLTGLCELSLLQEEKDSQSVLRNCSWLKLECKRRQRERMKK